MRSCFLVLGVLACLGVYSMGAAETAPAPDGAALLEKLCSTCHTSLWPKRAQKTFDQWSMTVSRMVGKGAVLTLEEKNILIDYLARTYKP